MWTETKHYGPTLEQIREQRRYETARDVMAAGYPDHRLFDDLKERARHAVQAADALLAELDREDV